MEWISVNESKPVPWQTVNLKCQDGTETQGFYSMLGNEFRRMDDEGPGHPKKQLIENVTHYC